jgi:hypothetical protein
MGEWDGSVSGVLTILLAVVRCSTYYVYVLYCQCLFHGWQYTFAPYWLCTRRRSCPAPKSARGAVARDDSTDKLNFPACHIICPFSNRACEWACGESGASRFIRMWKWPFDFVFVRVIFPVRHFYWLFAIVCKWYIQFVEQGKFPISFVHNQFLEKAVSGMNYIYLVWERCNVKPSLSWNK